MNRAEIIKKLIEKKGYNLKGFARKIDMPYTTFYSILQRGVSKAGIDNVIKICKGLDITVEELEEMAEKDTLNINKPKDEIHTIAAHGSENLTEEEIKELEEYAKYLMSKRKDKEKDD